MFSFGIDSALALAIANRSREFAAGSGNPCLAARVISRENFENSLDRILSWRSFLNWMFLNFEWPAIYSLPARTVGFQRRTRGGADVDPLA